MAPKATVLLALCCLAVVTLADSSSELAAVADTAGDEKPVKLKDVYNGIPNATDILGAIETSLTIELKNKDTQGFNTAVATTIGLVMVLFGEFVLKYVVVGFVSVFVFVLSQNVMTAKYSSFPPYAQIGFSFEVAAFAGAVSWLGYEGVQLWIGALVGNWLFIYVSQGFPPSVASTWQFFVIGNNVCILGGIFVFWWGKFHKRAMACISSVMGGAFLASGIVAAVVMAAQHFSDEINKKFPSLGLHGEQTYWIEIFWMIVGDQNTPKDVGIFQNVKVVVVGSAPICVDAWIGRAIWFLATAAGIWIQRRREKTRVAAASVSGREAMQEPLLSGIA